MKRKYFKYLIFLIITIFTELFAFNFRTFESLTFPSSQGYTVRMSDGTLMNPEQYITVENEDETYIIIDDIDALAYNLYLNASLANNSQEKLTVQLWARDEGNNQYYRLPEITISPDNENSKYIKLNLSGKAKSIKITFKDLSSDTIYIDEIDINCFRPLSLSVLRIVSIYILLMIVYALRPKSGINKISFVQKSRQKTILVAVLLLAELSVTCGVAAGHDTYCDPPWVHHYQYHELAVAITEGHFYLDIEPSTQLQQMENPYDTGERDALDVDSQWDTAYYNGKYYVYFGILPVFIYYLPYYLITGEAFPTFVGIIINCAAIIVGVYSLLGILVKKYFPNTSIGFFIILQVLGALGSGLLLIVNPPTFYNMPVSLGLALTLWGLYFWIKSIKGLNEGINRPNLVIGSVFMALVAACRPQLLVGSFLAVPLFWNALKTSITNTKKQTAVTILQASIPYIITAVFLMYYNYTRFGSPLDFGANYNLTTNDMTHRGFHLDRLPFGLFMYLIQPPSFYGRFPFMTPTEIGTGYQGTTILETMYGGFFWFNLIAGSLFFFGYARKFLKTKGLSVLCVMSALMAVIVVCADIQMAGILQRYGCDYGVFFIFASWLVILTIHEKIVLYENNCHTRHFVLQNLFSKIMLVIFLLTILINALWLLAA